MDDDNMSLASIPSHKPAGFASFKLKSILKDPVLLQRLASSDTALNSAFKKAGLNPDARLGVLIKYASKSQLDDHHYILVNSYNISCNSTWGPIDLSEDYVGLVLYAKDGTTDWRCNGVHCQAGYIYYRKTSEINHIDSDYGQVHGKLYKSLFNEEPIGVTGSGFAICKGHWRWKSGTFNDWLPAGMRAALMDEKEQIFVKEAVLRFASTGCKVRIADPHDLFLLAPDSVLLRSTDVDAATRMMGRLLIREGQTAITAQRATNRSRSVKNSIHFEISWTSGRKQKSIYMRKPPHYLVYQLSLDIEAHTGIRAETQLLMLYGDELKPFNRLSSSGLAEGDVVQLTQRTAEQQMAQQLQLSKRAAKLLGQVMPASGALALVPEEDE